MLRSTITAPHLYGFDPVKDSHRCELIMKGITMCSKHTIKLIFVLSCFFIVGCNSYVTEGPGPAVRVDDPKAPYATIRYNSVVFLDKSLSRSLEQNEIFGWQIGPKQISKIAVENQG